MSRISIAGKLKVFLILLLLVLVIVGIFPGVGGEGAQREIPVLSEKQDWWNFSTAALYGLWPNGFFPWTFSLTIAQLMIYAVGVWLMRRELKLSQNRRLFNFLAMIGGVFAFQLWRDATLLAIETLSLGLLIGAKATLNIREVLRYSLAFLTSLSGCLFKPIFAPLVLLIFFFILISKINSRRLLIVFSIIALGLSFIPFGLDKVLSTSFQLKKSYPEQQVLIYDLSKLYCWGYSPEATSSAKKLLNGILANRNDYESICASLSPAGWDSLHVLVPEVKSSPALRTIGEGEEESLNELKTGWIRTVLHNPMDWLMTKTSDASQVLFMANAFYMPGLYVDSNNLITSLGDKIIKIILIPFHILDKIRIFSIAFTLFIGLVMVYRNRASTQFSKSKEQILFKFISINLFTVSFATVAFIANNGRYVLPYILLSYFFLIISLDREKIKLI